MTNLITRAGWEARRVLYREQMPPPSSGTGSADDSEVTELVRDATADLVDHLLFVDEAALAGRIQGSSGFAERFSARGPRDRHGRSLREFDLERRLFRYPCSYMIYTEAFDALPDLAKDAIDKRMWQIFSGQETEDRYTRFSLADRQDSTSIRVVGNVI